MSERTGTYDLLYELISAAKKRYAMHGPDLNERKCVEEMGELIAALSHVKDRKVTPSQVAKEVADVIFTAFQVSERIGLVVVMSALWRVIQETNRVYEDFKNKEEIGMSETKFNVGDRVYVPGSEDDVPNEFYFTGLNERGIAKCKVNMEDDGVWLIPVDNLEKVGE